MSFWSQRYGHFAKYCCFHPFGGPLLREYPQQNSRFANIVNHCFVITLGLLGPKFFFQKLLESAILSALLFLMTFFSEASLFWFSWPLTHLSWNIPQFELESCAQSSPQHIHTRASFSKGKFQPGDIYSSGALSLSAHHYPCWPGPCPGEAGHPESHGRQVDTHDGAGQAKTGRVWETLGWIDDGSNWENWMSKAGLQAWTKSGSYFPRISRLLQWVRNAIAYDLLFTVCQTFLYVF